MTERALPAPALLAVVGLAGTGTMTVELAAVRLLAPWFGASSGVWTNVIGVVLLALALGYLVGARLSRGSHPWRALGVALLLGASLTAWLPWAAGPVARLFMPSGVALDQAADLFVWGSLAASLVLFLPSALVLGAAGPLAVELLVRETRMHAGDAGGRVLAVSTLGSLVGTFGTTHVFLPRRTRGTAAGTALATDSGPHGRAAARAVYPARIRVHADSCVHEFLCTRIRVHTNPCAHEFVCT